MATPLEIMRAARTPRPHAARRRPSPPGGARPGRRDRRAGLDGSRAGRAGRPPPRPPSSSPPAAHELEVDHRAVQRGARDAGRRSGPPPRRPPRSWSSVTAAARRRPAAGPGARPQRLHRLGARLLPGAADQRLRRRLRRPDGDPAAGRRPPERHPRAGRRGQRRRRAGAGHRAAGRRDAPRSSSTPSPRRRPPSRPTVAEYRAAFDQLSAQEQQVAVAGHDDDRASRSAEREEPPPPAARSWRAARPRRSPSTRPWRSAASPTSGPASGPGSFDCSGLTAYAFAAAGVYLPHSSRMQSQMGQSVSRDAAPARRPGLLLQPGQPRRHLHRQRADGARPVVRRRGEGGPADVAASASARRIAG